MIKNIVLFTVVLLMVACSSEKKNESLGGLEGLAWGSDISTVREYMSTKPNISYDYYKFIKEDNILQLKYSGSEYNGNKVNNWVLKIKQDKFVAFELEFATNVETDFQNIEKLFIGKLNQPVEKSDSRITWASKKTKEKVILEKYESSVLLIASKL